MNDFIIMSNFDAINRHFKIRSNIETARKHYQRSQRCSRKQNTFDFSTSRDQSFGFA